MFAYVYCSPSIFGFDEQYCEMPTPFEFFCVLGRH